MRSRLPTAAHRQFQKDTPAAQTSTDNHDGMPTPEALCTRALEDTISQIPAKVKSATARKRRNMPIQDFARMKHQPPSDRNADGFPVDARKHGATTKTPAACM